MTARELFNRKYPTLLKDVEYKLKTRWRRLPEHIRDDVLQEAALDLWRQCQRGIPPERLKVGFSTRNGHARAVQRYYRDRQRLGESTVYSINGLRRAAPRVAVRMGHGLFYNLADARLDDPEAFNKDLIDGCEAARRLGMCRSRVTQLAKRLGGRRIGRLLLFPPDVAERYRAELAAKQAETITTRQLAERLGTSEQAIAARAHRLGGRKVGRHWRFPADTGLEPEFKLPKLPARIRKRSDA